MAFSYVAGSSTPDWFGSIEFPSLLFSKDGSFRSFVIPPLWQSAPVELVTAPLPTDGGIVSAPKLTVWQFDVTGWLYDDDLANIQGGMDYLFAKINAANGWQTVNIKGHGWSAVQTMTLQVAGQISFEPRDKGDITVPERNVTIPVIAADPRRYGAATDVTITTATNVTNNGNAKLPIDVTFNGPRDTPLLNGPGAGNTIQINRNLASSSNWVRVQMADPTTGLMTAVDETGADAFGDVDVDRARYIDPGTSAWTVTSASGSGLVKIKQRDAHA